MTATFVTGRTATADETCGTCGEAAVSAFLIGKRLLGLACERHIIATHEAAEATLTPQAYVRGSRTGRVNLSRVVKGQRVLVELDSVVGLRHATRKTGALVATVTGKRKGGWRMWVLETDLGEFETYGMQTMWTLV